MKIKTIKKVKAKNSVLIEGLPGIGNVGKLAVDYAIKKTKPTLVAEISSEQFPALVIISEKHVVEKPAIKILHKKIGTKNYFFVAGDFQPNSEEGTYALAKQIIQYSKEQDVKLIITLGGIGLEQLNENPKVLATSNKQNYLRNLKNAGADTKIFGKVGTILGVTGLLLGLSEKITSAALLAETTFEPGLYALLSAKHLLKTINKLTGLKISVADIQKEFDEGKGSLEKLEHLPRFEETNYIG